MDYYEELGIAPSASEEEISRAHRRMTKLLHPDQHTDESLKQLAEVQMRRLNSIVAVLLDPESRREYDEQLRTEGPGYPGMRSANAKKQRRRPSWPWWVVSTAAAVLLTVVVVWFWAGNFGSTFGNHNPTYIPDSREAPSSAAEVTQPSAHSQVSASSDPAKQSNVAATQPTMTADVPTVVHANPSQTLAKVPADSDPVTPQTEVASDAGQNSPAHKKLVLPKSEIAAVVHPAATHVDLPPAPGLSIANPSRVEASVLPLANVPIAPPKPPPAEAPPTKTVSYSASTKSVPSDPLEGEWVYAPKEPEKKKAGFYPPEFIDLKLVRDDGRLHGQYHARYHVADKPISPDVEFVLSPDTDDHKFTWRASNGTRGTFKISAVDPNVIRVEWRTTVFSRQPALTAGTATLIKRTQ